MTNCYRWQSLNRYGKPSGRARFLGRMLAIFLAVFLLPTPKAFSAESDGNIEESTLALQQTLDQLNA
jgi:hypothetical protein